MISEREGLKNFSLGEGERQLNELLCRELYKRSVETSLRHVFLFISGAYFLSALCLGGEL